MSSARVTGIGAGLAKDGSFEVSLNREDGENFTFALGPVEFDRVINILLQYHVSDDGRLIERRLPADDLYPAFSSMDHYYEHVWCIGMISTDVTRLDVQLSGLLAGVLGISFDHAAVIYLTPKSAFGRLEMIENLIPSGLAGKPELLKRARSIVGRAKAIVQKRHTIIHEAWLEDEGEVRRFSLPQGDATSVPLSDLRRIIREIRSLLIDLTALVADLGQQGTGGTEQQSP